MNNIEERNNTIITIIGKSVILILNFAIVVCTTRFWGAEGKGYIAIFTANLSFISIVTNIFTNSSIAYYVNKVGASKLFLQACLWTFISTTLGIFVCSITGKNTYLLLLFITAILSGYLTFHNALYIGLQKIKYFNFITILQPLLLLIIILILHYNAKSTFLNYFYAHIVSFVLVILFAHFLTYKTVGKIKAQLDYSIAKYCFNYGFKCELGNFLQFFVNRLSYYFIVYYFGKPTVGVFAVGISIAESIWIVCKSISMVQYSKVLHEGNTKNARNGIVKTSLYSGALSFICIGIGLLLPKSIYGYVFGPEFSDVKYLFFLMSPGILAVSFALIPLQYFSALGKLSVQILRSVFGVVLTIPLLVLLIPHWGLKGACITTSTVHILCSAFVMIVFIITIRKHHDTI